MQTRLRKMGAFMSSMILPNIGAFITWGFITALFIPSGWLPNPSFAGLVEPMAKYLLPTLIGYTGGKLIYDVRGGVIGSAVTFGVIVGSEVPMFAGAMIMGPLSAYALKELDRLLEKRIVSGFEMLFSNFTSGLLGLTLTLISYRLIGPIMTLFNKVAAGYIRLIIEGGYIAFASIIIEPAKVLFLNNIINHGVLSPIGLVEANEYGKSILFLLETNPGPGLGVLLAYALFGKGIRKKSAPGAMLVHFFGGIHEVYFPYVLANPLMILPVIAGGFVGNITFQMMNVGLTATPSPGSVFSILALSAKGDQIGVISGIVLSAVTAFLCSLIFIKEKKSEKELVNLPVNVSKIAFACDAGMGSSAMAASQLKKKLRGNIEVLHCPVGSVPEDVDLIITHELLKKRIKSHQAPIIGVKDLMQDQVLDQVINKYEDTEGDRDMFFKKDKGILRENRIYTSLESEGKEEAIRRAGRALLKEGLIDEAYITGMLQREEIATTYIGSSVAIPHGTNESKQYVKETGIVFLQYPEGVDFGEGNIAKLVIGIAAKGDEHMDILMKIAEAVSNNETLEFLTTEENGKKIFKQFEKSGLGG